MKCEKCDMKSISLKLKNQYKITKKLSLFNAANHCQFNIEHNSLDFIGKKSHRSPTSAAKKHNINSLHVLPGASNQEKFKVVEPNNKQKMLLEEQQRDCEASLLDAIKTNNINTVKTILQYSANINHRDKQQLATNIAYEIKSWNSLLFLLQNGFPFPNDFNENDIPKSEHELTKFIDNNKDFSNLIAAGNSARVAELVDLGVIRNYFRNITNQSAITIAFTSKNFENYVFLKAKGFKELCHEPPVDVFLLSPLDKISLKNAMASFVKSGQPLH